MRIRTIEHLQDRLDNEFAWRKKELVHSYQLVFQGEGTSNQRFYIRSGIAMLYAHWEGFVKVMSQCYLEFVSNRGLSNGQLSDSLLSAVVRKQYLKATRNGKHEAYIELVHFFRNRLSERSVLPVEDAVSTKSNLNSEVLKDIINVLGFDYTDFATSENLLDETLLGRRNLIAHGNNVTVSPSEFCDLYHRVLDLMATFGDQITLSAQKATYSS